MIETFKKLIYFILGYAPIYLAFWLNKQDVKWWQMLLIITGGTILSLSCPILNNKN